MSEVIVCDICNVEMKLEKRFKNRRNKDGVGSYRVRRFGCPICGLTKTVYADGNDEFDITIHDALRQAQRDLEGYKSENVDDFISEVEYKGSMRKSNRDFKRSKLVKARKMISKEDLDLVERYLRKELPENEISAFEKRLASDALLMRAMKDIADVSTSAKIIGRERLKKKLQAIAKENGL